jgi:hypothetical protein
MSKEGAKESKLPIGFATYATYPVVFITAYADHDTVARIHEEIPGAPVIAKSLYRGRLAKAVKEAVALR